MSITDDKYAWFQHACEQAKGRRTQALAWRLDFRKADCEREIYITATQGTLSATTMRYEARIEPATADDVIDELVSKFKDF